MFLRRKHERIFVFAVNRFIIKVSIQCIYRINYFALNNKGIGSGVKMKEETCVFEGNITVPVTVKLKLESTVSKEEAIRKAIEQLDNTMNEEIICKAELKLTTFSGREMQLQADDITLEWESITIEGEVIRAEKETTPKRDG